MLSRNKLPVLPDPNSVKLMNIVMKGKILNLDKTSTLSHLDNIEIEMAVLNTTVLFRLILFQLPNFIAELFYCSKYMFKIELSSSRPDH